VLVLDAAAALPTETCRVIAARPELDPDTMPAVELGVLLSVLPRDHPLVVAARLGLEVGDSREGVPLGADYAGGRFHRNHELAEYGDVQRLRWPPTGDRDLWVRYGPAGPPACASVKSEAAA
jgi:hypothetical protein